MRKKLTARSVASIRPGDRRVEVWDQILPGFGIRVSPTGAKRWFVKVRHDGKQRRYPISPHLSLAEARREARRLIATPPVVAKMGSNDPNFEDAIGMFIERWSKVRCRSWQEIERVLRTKFPSLMPMPVVSITRRHVSEAVAMIAAPAMANKSLGCVKKMFSWLVDQGVIETHPCLRMAMPAPKSVRDRVLTDAELAAIWKATYERENRTRSVFEPHGAYYRLLILTAQRKTETALMDVRHVVDNLWSIPAAHSKNGRAHLVPLSRQAMVEIDALKSKPVLDFPSTVTHWRVKARLDELSGVTGWRNHDLRRTAATGMASLGVAPHVIERILNHAGIISGVAKIYNRHSYQDECREALQLWADYVDSIVR